MPVSALGLAMAAAVVHALWNVLLARSRDVEAATAVALPCALVVWAPAVVATWRVEASAWPYIVASGCLELAYFVLLVLGYRVAELSVVYPIARGVAPVLVLLAAVVVLGRSASALQVLGVVLVGVGVLLVRGLRGGGPGALLGLCVALTIASYTLVDKTGVTHAAPLAYLELAMLFPALGYPALVAAVRGPSVLRRGFTLPTIAAGIASFGAYELVLLALQRAPAAPVAAVRESSVVIAALLARRYLREPVGKARLAGAAAVAGGIAALALG